MNRISSIIFDLEGVIIDTEPLWDKVSEVFLKRRNILYERERIKPLMMGRTISEGIKVIKETYGLRGKIEELVKERRELAQELFSQEIAFIPGFFKFYQTLKNKFKTAIATSLDKNFLNSVDKKINLSKLFNHNIFSIAEIGYISKPNPDIFLYAAKKINSIPTECIVVEDSPYGVEAAKRAGMKCIAITTSTGRENLTASDIVVDSFLEASKKLHLLLR